MTMHLLLSFVLGGAFIAFCSIAADVFGAEIGGLIAGLPSTVVITLLFVALTESPDEAVRETTIIPLALALNCLFLLAFARGAKVGAIVALTAALTTWLALAAIAALLAPRDLNVSLSLWALTFGGSFVMLRRYVGPEANEPVPPQSSAMQILGRASFGGCVIAVGVWLSRAGGPVIGGVAAVFPAAGVSTLAVVSWSRGVAFATQLLNPMLVSGSTTILVYALAVRFTYLSLGVVVGTLTAFVATGATAAVIYRWRRPRVASKIGATGSTERTNNVD